MLLRVNQVAFGLGRGVLGASPNRMGVWTQGCSLPKCPGCTSSHTWSARGGKSWPVDALVRRALAENVPPAGLVISGGEPTDQTAAVCAFICKFRRVFPGTEIALYTGLRWRVFVDRFPKLVEILDVVVAGPYVQSRDATPLTGSANQEVRVLTPLGKSLYRNWQSWPPHKLQVAHASGNDLVTVGIPHVPRMSQAASEIDVVDVTWNPETKGEDE